MLSSDQKLKLVEMLKQRAGEALLEKDGSKLYTLGPDDTITVILAPVECSFNNMSDEEIDKYIVKILST